MAKLTRKERLKKDDAFLSAAKGGALWMQSHRNQVIVGTVGAIAVILSTWGMVEYVDHRDRTASSLFDAALETLDAVVSDAPAAGGREQYATEQEKLTRAKERFEAARNAGSAGGVGALSTLYIGDIEVQLGETEAALATFQQLVDTLAPHDSLFFVAVERAALLQEQAGDVDGALRTLSRLTNLERGFYRDVATYHQARLYLAQGNQDRARNLFEHIDTEFPNSLVAEKVREQLAALPPTDATAQNEAPAGEQQAQ